MDITGNNITLEWIVIASEDLKISGTGCTLKNCTIWNGKLDVDESCTVYNTIVQNPSGDDIDIANGKTVTGSHNCFSDAAHVGTGTYTDLGGNTKWGTDPLLANPSGGVFTLRTISPCCDSGDNSIWAGTASVTDYDDNAITDSGGAIVAVGGQVDIGAFECQTTLAVQEELIASADKRVSWLFQVTNSASTVTYKWSTKAKTFRNVRYTYNIEPDSIKLTLNHAKSEMDLQAPNELSFEALNVDNEITASDFKGGTVLLYIVLGNGAEEDEVRAFKFSIKQCGGVYQKLSFSCVDFLQAYLDSDYPNGKLIKDIIPSNDTNIQDNICVPQPFGSCYVPLRSIYITDARYYVLGSADYSYTINRVRSPRTWGARSEWYSDNYSFTQSTETIDSTGWRVFQPIIADSDSDGTADACGLWKDGEHFYDMPTQFSRSDTASTTAPADVIEYVVEDFGASSNDVDTGSGSSFGASETTYTGWGLTFNGAYFYKQPRERVLPQLLNMCHSTLRVTDKIELHVLSKTSQQTITRADVKQGTFRKTPITETLCDSGYVAYQENWEAQDELIKISVPVKSTKNNISSDILILPFVQNSQHVQHLGQLFYQRKFLKENEVSFTSKGTLLGRYPGQFITISHADYGGTYDVLIDSMTIKHDLSIQVVCTQFSDDIDDWDDLSPSAVTVAVDDSTSVWSPVISGPITTVSSGSQPAALQSGEAIVLESGADLRLDGGADIYLTGSDTDPGIIQFVGTSYTTKIGGNADGTNFIIAPSTDEKVKFLIGSETGYVPYTNQFETIKLFSYENFIARVEATTGQDFASFIALSYDSLTSPYYSRVQMYAYSGNDAYGRLRIEVNDTDGDAEAYCEAQASDGSAYPIVKWNLTDNGTTQVAQLGAYYGASDYALWDLQATSAGGTADLTIDGVDVFEAEPSGILSFAKQSGCRVYLSSDQSINDVTWTKIELDTEVRDTQNEFDSTTNHRFTATVAGDYMVCANGRIELLDNGELFEVAIYKNGVAVARVRQTSTAADQILEMVVADIITLAANDYLELWMYHTHSPSLNVGGGQTYYTYLSIQKVG